MVTALELSPTPALATTEPRTLIWVLDEHLDFAHDFCALEALILSRGHDDHPSLRADLAAWLRSVLPRMDAHSMREERSALYTVLPIQHPVFAPTIARLKAEHRAIAETLRGLLATVDSTPQPRLLAELATLLRLVRRHEADEDDILLEAYFADAGEDD